MGSVVISGAVISGAANRGAAISVATKQRKRIHGESAAAITGQL